jgi:protein TonB
VRFPQCEYCPAPSYTAAARRERCEGAVILGIVITAEGRATDIHIIKGAPCGLTLQAIEAVRKWRFKPAVGPDGKPVAVQTTIETTFRLL